MKLSQSYLCAQASEYMKQIPTKTNGERHTNYGWRLPLLGTNRTRRQNQRRYRRLNYVTRALELMDIYGTQQQQNTHSFQDPMEYSPKQNILSHMETVMRNHIWDSVSVRSGPINLLGSALISYQAPPNGNLIVYARCWLWVVAP